MMYITWEQSTDLPQAEAIAEKLALPLLSKEQLPPEGYRLWVTSQRIFLELRQGKTSHQLSSEFLKGSMGYRLEKGGGLHQALAKAVGVKSRAQACSVLDGTAGLGNDGFILAMLGCKVLLVERSKLMCVLLADGLKRAEQDIKIGPKVKSNLRLRCGQLRDYLQELSRDTLPDVIYLDPMFPESKKSALTKMEMRIIRDIVGSDTDASILLTESFQKARKRVVVKRPLHASYLLDKKPSYIVAGKRNRYDVYLTGGSINIYG